MKQLGWLLLGILALTLAEAAPERVTGTDDGWTDFGVVSRRDLSRPLALTREGKRSFAWFNQVDPRRTVLIKAALDNGAIEQHDFSGYGHTRIALYRSPLNRQLYAFGGSPAHFFKYEPERRTFRDLGIPDPRASYFLGSAPGADGKWYMGNFPAASLLCLNTADDTVRNLGRLPDDPRQQYLLHPVVDRDGVVYCPVGQFEQELYTYDPRDGRKRRFSRPEWKTSPSMVSVFLDGRGRAFARHGERGYTLTADTVEPVAELPKPGQGVPSMAVDGEVRLGRLDLSGELEYRIGRERRTVRLELPPVCSELLTMGRELHGWLYFGTLKPAMLCRISVATGRVEQVTADTTGKVQVYDMLEVDGKLIISSYPFGALDRFDPVSGTMENIARLGESGHERLTEIIRARDGMIYSATVPTKGKLGGALLRVDPHTGVLRLFHGIVPEQSFSSLRELPSGELLLASQIRGGTGSVPTAERAELVIWDPATERTLWRGRPFEDCGGYTGLCFDGRGRLCGVTNDRRYYVFDPATRTFLMTGALPAVEGEVRMLRHPAADGAVYGVSDTLLWRIDPESGQLRVLADRPELRGGYCIGADSGGRLYFGARGRLLSCRTDSLTSRSKNQNHKETRMKMKKFTPIPINAIRLDDPVLAPRLAICRQTTIPACIQKCRTTGRFDAFRLDWREGMPNRPHFFWDSDVAKVLEGMALMLLVRPDPELEKELESYVELVISAQQPDGYLNLAYTTWQKGHRWEDLCNKHELYCAGHLMEAAVAHYQATGRRNFLDAMCRYADYIGTVFGRGEGRKRGYPGHQELELALCKLADATGRREYAELARYFIDERGAEPNYFRGEHPDLEEEELQLRQAHRPIREQRDADGHAVRLLYMCCGMADVAARFDDAELLRQCETLFDSVANRRMYLTGGVGSTSFRERFTRDYHLPNDSAYAESCASIALVLFCRRMLNLTGEVRYADVLEQTLYNGALSGISLAGDTFFYANLLEVDDNTNEHRHVRKTRQAWFNCSCCPPNFCRFLPQLGTFLWSTGDDEVRLHIPAAGRIDTRVAGRPVKIAVEGGYPYDGNVLIRFETGGRFKFSFRRPGWCAEWRVKLNGRPLAADGAGYQTLDREWLPGDRLTLELAMPVRRMHAHCKVTGDAGRGALMRGPLVYALESIDNGKVLPQLILSAQPEFTLVPASGLPAGTPAIRGRAFREMSDESGKLYFESGAYRYEAVTVTAVPYMLWQNRGPADMAVWIRDRQQF